MPDSNDRIEGRQPILEALKAGRPINRILIQKTSERHGQIAEIIHLAKQRRVIIDFVEKEIIERNSGTHHSQGIVASVSPKEYTDIDEIVERVKARGEKLFLLLLDGIEDPQNLGAIIRSADGAGVHAVVIPKRRAASVTSTVAKTSAGAVEHIPICRVNNLNDLIRNLKDDRVWVVGLDEKGEQEYTKADFTLPTALVIGGEGGGLSRLVKENCDYLVKIPMLGKISSLNASVSAALVMYEVVRQRAVK